MPSPPGHWDSSRPRTRIPTNDGRPKRWVVVCPAGAQTGILLARADGGLQVAVLGNQHAGGVGFLLRVDDCDTSCQHRTAAGVEFSPSPRTEPYGRDVIFRDITGNCCAASS